ncbi:MAG: cellulase family glycosylhydrolase [Candidatus Woykebacteria bacterium]
MAHLFSKKIIKEEKKIVFILCVFIVALFFYALLSLVSFFLHSPRFRSVISSEKYTFINSNQSLVNSAFFYGVNVDMSLLLPTSKKYVVNSQGEDLIDIAARLGINLFRITNSEKGLDSNRDSIYTKEQWSMVLDKMQRKKIKALIVIENASDNPDLYKPTISSSYLQLVQDYIISSDVLSHSNIYAIDLKNEPIVNMGNNVSTIRMAAQMIKKKYPKTLLTVGWWGIDTFKKDRAGKEIYNWEAYDAGKTFDDFIDFYSIHMYGFEKKVLGLTPEPYFYAKSFLSNIKNELKTKKPILIEEFGASNGEAVSDQETVGSAELQANVYAGVYQALSDMKDPQIFGAVSYQFSSRSNIPDAWAILKDHGDYLFPASYVLQKFATGQSDMTLNVPYSSTPNDYLLTNQDNNRTITISKNDLVGLHINLDNNYNNLVKIDNSYVLSGAQQLIYDDQKNKFNAVFHAKDSGIAVVQVTQENKCVQNEMCSQTKTEKFKITIVVKN